MESYEEEATEEEEEEMLDKDAELLPVNEPRIAVTGDQEEIVKKLEVKYFAKFNLDDSLLFGGTLGKSEGGVTAFTTASNGKLVA